MKETQSRSGFDKVTTYLGDVWRGVTAPEDVLSKRRKRIDGVMVATGTLGMAESLFIIRSPLIFAASFADMAIGMADLAYAGSQVRHASEGPAAGPK